MRSRIKRTFLALMLPCLLVATTTNGCGESSPKASGGGNSETHFLQTCDGACGGGLECLCGVCTKPCETSNACADLLSAAECTTCDGTGSSARVCDVTCRADAECGSLGAGFHCVSGRCRKENAMSGDANGGRGDSGAANLGGESTASGAGSAPGGTGGAAAGGTGAGGAGGVAATCNGGPDETPTQVAPAELSPDEVALVAAVVGSCWGDDGVDRNAAHVWEADLRASDFFFRTALQADCLVNARCGCAAVEHCLGVEVVATSAACTPGCAGDVFTACGPEFDLEDGYQIRTDCSRVGLACDSSGRCVEDSPAACTDGAPVVCNTSGEAEFCERGVLRHGPACPELGLDCGANGCIGRGAACAGSSSDPSHALFSGLTCTGDVLQACVGGQETSIDCTLRGPGFHCQRVGDAAFCGLASECVPAGQFSPSETHPASCDGPVLTFCNAGRLEHIDCAALGFTGCTIDSSAYAYGCTPGPAGSVKEE